MKIINNEKGYATSIILLLLLIPLIMLMVVVIEEYSNEADNTLKSTESEKIKSKTEDFENEIISITKKSLNEVTLDVINSQKPLFDSQKYMEEYIGKKVTESEKKYEKENVNIKTTIKSIKPSEDPFKIELAYHIMITMNNSDVKINKEVTKLVEITDDNYPVYDPLPILKTQASFNDNKISYGDKLTKYIELDNSKSYLNVVTPIIIKKCPYSDYSQHGNSNSTILNCIHNHYYHNSHDGMCLLCRLENKTSCNHYGFETFIIPTEEYDKAPVSIDHVLLNDKNTQYSGNKIVLDNQSILYLDNGHKNKYGL